MLEARSHSAAETPSGEHFFSLDEHTICFSDSLLVEILFIPHDYDLGVFISIQTKRKIHPSTQRSLIIQTVHRAETGKQDVFFKKLTCDCQHVNNHPQITYIGGNIKKPTSCLLPFFVIAELQTLSICCDKSLSFSSAQNCDSELCSDFSLIRVTRLFQHWSTSTDSISIVLQDRIGCWVSTDQYCQWPASPPVHLKTSLASSPP